MTEFIINLDAGHLAHLMSDVRMWVREPWIGTAFPYIDVYNSEVELLFGIVTAYGVHSVAINETNIGLTKKDLIQAVMESPDIMEKWVCVKKDLQEDIDGSDKLAQICDRPLSMDETYEINLVIKNALLQHLDNIGQLLEDRFKFKFKLKHNSEG